jgi:hypothetical protein
MEPFDADLDVHAVVRPLASWPDQQVERAYRLCVAALRSLGADGAAHGFPGRDAESGFADNLSLASGDAAAVEAGAAAAAALDDARDDAERYGLELVRRGLI